MLAADSGSVFIGPGITCAAESRPALSNFTHARATAAILGMANVWLTTPYKYYYYSTYKVYSSGN